MPQRIKMVEREPNVRNKDFKEVNLGYTDEQALSEAKRCLNCTTEVSLETHIVLHLLLIL